MAHQVLFPATGLTVYDEFGNLVPSTGIGPVDTSSAYYAEQMRQGRLRTVDPLSVNHPPAPGVYAPVTLGLVTTQLAGYAIQRDAQYVTTIGYATPGDGGGATFSGALGVSSGADTYTKINASNGQWQMVWSKALIDVRAFGVKADGLPASAAANQAGIIAAIAAMPIANGLYRGGSVQLPAGTIYHNANIPIPWGVTLRGADGSPLGGGVTRLFYYGADGRSTIAQLSPGSNTVIENLTLGSVSGRIHSIVAFDFPVGSTLVTHPLLRNIEIYGLGTVDIGEADYCLTIGTLAVSGGNLEMIHMDRVACSNPRIAFLKVGNLGGQPYNCVMDRCSWTQYRGGDVLHHGPNTPYGWGVINENQSFSLTMRSLSVHAVGILVQATQEFHCAIENIDSEYVKRLLNGGGYASGTLPFLCSGKRFAVAAFPGVAAYDENDAVIVAAGNLDFINYFESGPIVLTGLVVDNNSSHNNLRLRVAFGGDITLIGCVLPNMEPVQREPSPFATEAIGGTYVQGCRGITGAGEVEHIPDRDGCQNPVCFVTITGAATTQVLTLPYAESDPNYMVDLSYYSETGAPAAGSRVAWATARSTTQLTANVATAPGGVATVTFAVHLRLQP